MAERADVGANEPTIVTQTGEEFETEFGLEGNPVGEAAEEAGASADELEQAVGEVLEMDEEFDNVDRLDRITAREQEAEGAEEEEAEGEEAEAEGDEELEEEEAEEEGEEEEGEGDEEEEDEEEEGTPSPLAERIAKMQPESAQKLFEQLLEHHGDALRVRHRANGEDVETTFAQLRDNAAGYQGARAESVRKEREAEAKVKGAQTIEQRAKELVAQVKEQRAALKTYLTEDAGAFVNEVLLRYSNPQFIRALRDQLDGTVRTIEDDPFSFQTTQRLGRVETAIESLTKALSGNGNGRAAPKADETETGTGEEEAGIPDDFGFIPGRGFPNQYLPYAKAALQAAAKVAGLDYDKVLDEWDAGERKEHPQAVLERMARMKPSETAKVEKAKKRGGKRRPKTRSGGVRTSKPNKAARQQTRWDDIEKSVAKEVEALVESGELLM